jgi:hypothetical protein
VLVRPGFARRKVSLPPKMARELNHNILSEWMTYYLRYTTRKKCVMLEFSLLELVTSEPRVVAIPEAPPTQPLPCSFHAPTTWHTIWVRSWAFAGVPLLPCHALDVDTHPHVSFTFDWLIKRMVSLTIHCNSSLL